MLEGSARMQQLGFAAVVLLSTLGQLSCLTEARTAKGPFRLEVTDGFTIAVIPDTQCYTSEGGGRHPGGCGSPKASNEMFLAQARYIMENQGVSRIVAAVGVGDIVMCGDERSEWENAKKAYDIVDAAGIPYVPVMGNHDYDLGCGALSSRAATNYNTYLGPSRFAGKLWYGGGFPANSNENFFVLFSVDGEDYLVLALEYRPRDISLAWAQQVIDSHPQSNVIITLNDFLDVNGTRLADGERIWENLVRKNANVIVVVDSFGRTARRVDACDAGNLVAQMSSSYQFEESGGNGYMRLLHFQPATQRVEVFTYSPFVGVRRLDPDNDFTIEYGRR